MPQEEGSQWQGHRVHWNSADSDVGPGVVRFGCLALLTTPWSDPSWQFIFLLGRAILNLCHFILKISNWELVFSKNSGKKTVLIQRRSAWPWARMTHKFVKFILCSVSCASLTLGLTSVIKQKLKDNDITQLKKNVDTLWDIQKYLKDLWLPRPRLEKSQIYSVIAMNLQSSALFMGQFASSLMWYAFPEQSPGLFDAYNMSSWTNKGSYCNVKKEGGGGEEKKRRDYLEP